MGLPMAKNLLSAGHELAVYNRSAGPDDELARAGARKAYSPAEAAEDAEAVLLMLADTDAVDEVLFDEEGVTEGLSEGAAVIDMSTISAGDSEDNAAELDEGGYRMLDAPVSGSVPVAERGELAFLVGGDEATVEEFRPVLETMGDRVLHLGPRGSGSRMKLVNNLVAAANLAALSEGLALGEAAGIPAEKQLEVFMTGAAASKLAELKGEKVSNRSHEAQFKLSHMVKDLRYALDLGYGLEQALPLTALVSQVYTAGLSQHGEDDISAVSEVSRRGSG